MNRDYINKNNDDNTYFFVGSEVENTPTKGMKTLFVVGIQDIQTIIMEAHRSNCRAIYFGANQSFAPNNYNDWEKWISMIKDALADPINFFCTLDFDVNFVEDFLESGLQENNRMIPMVSVKLPYMAQLGYNATIKLDDKDFNETNEGVWCHRLQDLRDPKSFTHWNEYMDDYAVEK